jgi:hypothetical protein
MFLAVLGASVKVRKATVTFVMSVRPPVRVEHLGTQWTDFQEIFMFEEFSKIHR